MNARIVVADDDPHLREVVRYGLARAGFTVTEAADGEAAWAQFESLSPDLLVLDVGMPTLDGLSLCRRIRAQSNVPILFLSCRGEEIDRVLGLDLGGDDYVTKPFSPRELVSRVRALLRRSSNKPKVSTIAAGALRLSPQSHDAWVGQTRVVLTATEFRLLAALVSRPDRVLTRTELAALAYPDGRRVSERTVDSHVRRIRAKLRPHQFDPIDTVHGVGFCVRGTA